jgi:PPOX class probable FMN-dependent enzyme
MTRQGRIAMASEFIETVEQLRRIYGVADDVVWEKSLPRLDGHCRALIAASPFLIMSTSRCNGTADASPRGDGPGFVRILDDSTLLIPDRPGNKRLDSLTNILDNPNVGLIFLIPGMDETVRVNGKARITVAPELLLPLAVKGRPPLAAILITVEEAYLHCAKAFIRSKLWDPASRIDRSRFPSLGRMIADQVAGLDAAAADEAVVASNLKDLY